MSKEIIVKVSDIKWDDAGSDVPTEMELVVNYQGMKDEFKSSLTEHECDIVDIIDDYVNQKISDVSGFCHFGYSLNILKCVACGGFLAKEDTNSCDYTCIDCDCMQSGDGTLCSDIPFYIANYGTMKNIEIFQDINKAKEESADGKVYQAILNGSRVWLENDDWNYEDTSDLFLKSPTEIQ